MPVSCSRGATPAGWGEEEGEFMSAAGSGNGESFRGLLFRIANGVSLRCQLRPLGAVLQSKPATQGTDSMYHPDADGGGGKTRTQSLVAWVSPEIAAAQVAIKFIAYCARIHW